MSGPDAPAKVLDWNGYAAAWSESHGGYDPRQAPVVVRGWLRLAYGLGVVLFRAGIRNPNLVTVVGLLLSVAVPVLAAGAEGWVLAGAGLVLLSAVTDTVDGALAVISGRASRLGQVYDSAADRVAEASWLVASAVIGAPVWLVVACGGLGWLHEYVRARATVAGMSDIGVVTVAERPTRIIFAVFTFLAAGTAGLLLGGRWPADTATGALVLLTLVEAVGFGQLGLAVRRALS